MKSLYFTEMGPVRFEFGFGFDTKSNMIIYIRLELFLEEEKKVQDRAIFC